MSSLCNNILNHRRGGVAGYFPEEILKVLYKTLELYYDYYIGL